MNKYTVKVNNVVIYRVKDGIALKEAIDLKDEIERHQPGHVVTVELINKPSYADFTEDT